MIRQHLKSKTQRFNAVMMAIDAAVLNFGLLQGVITAEQFGYTLFALKIVQTLGNFYLRSITTEPISEK